VHTHQAVPDGPLRRLRAVGGRLPEAHEEQAWVGTRWRIRQHTFAHAVPIDAGWPPAYARAAVTDGPAVVLTFRSSGGELHALRNAGPSFFVPGWFPDLVGVHIGRDTDWQEIAELVTESYRLLAPRKLAALLDDRPIG
jgi:YjbR